jgi:hypothetical protein
MLQQELDHLRIGGQMQWDKIVVRSAVTVGSVASKKASSTKIAYSRSEV